MTTTVWILIDVDEDSRINSVYTTPELAKEAADVDYGEPLADWRQSRGGRWYSASGDYEICEYTVHDEP